MTDSTDQRSTGDRRDRGQDPAEDAREEYAAYRETADAPDPNEEALREADLQPGSPEPPGEGKEEKPERTPE